MMIWRSCAYASLVLILSAAGASSAVAADDNASAVLADCGTPDLPDSAVDSCLERVRVLDETGPSPQLQSLEAQLQQRESGQRAAGHEPRPLQANSAPSQMAPYSSQPTVVESDHYLPPAAAEPDQGRSTAMQEPTTAMPDARADDERRTKTAESGTERPPAGIDDDLPPIADPPDSDAPPARSSDDEDDPQ